MSPSQPLSDGTLERGTHCASAAGRSVGSLRDRCTVRGPSAPAPTPTPSPGRGRPSRSQGGTRGPVSSGRRKGVCSTNGPRPSWSCGAQGRGAGRFDSGAHALGPDPAGTPPVPGPGLWLPPRKARWECVGGGLGLVSPVTCRDRLQDRREDVCAQLQILMSDYITITLLKKSMHINPIFKLMALRAPQCGSPGSRVTTGLCGARGEWCTRCFVSSCRRGRCTGRGGCPAWGTHPGNRQDRGGQPGMLAPGRAAGGAGRATTSREGPRALSLDSSPPAAWASPPLQGGMTPPQDLTKLRIA